MSLKLNYLNLQRIVICSVNNLSKIAIINLLLVSFLYADSLPQGRQYFKSYGVKQGLTDLAIRSIVQDDQGFIWVATTSGLFRYDGVKFREFGLDHGLPTVELNTIHKDTSGKMWFGTKNGLVVWEQSRFRQTGAPDLSISGVTSHKETVWIATGKGLYQLNEKPTQSSLWQIPKEWPSGEASAVHFGMQSKRLYAAVWSDKTLIGYLDKQGRWNNLTVNDEFNGKRIDSIVEDGAGTLWIRSARGLWTYDETQQRFNSVKSPVEVMGSYGYMLEGRKGDILIPNDNGILQYKDNQWFTKSLETGLPETWWRAAYEDREGSLWIGGLGVSKILGRDLWQAYTAQEGFDNEVIWSIKKDRDGRYWVGTDNGIYTHTEHGWRLIEASKGFVIRSLVHLKDGKMIGAGYPVKELLLLDPKTETVTKIPVKYESEPAKIFRVLVDKNDIVWLATANSGLLKGSLGSALSMTRVTLPEDMVKNDILDVRADHSGDVWATGRSGLYVNHNNKWMRFSEKDGLLVDRVSTMVMLKNGDILIGYIEPVGLSIFHFDGKEIEVKRHIQEQDGLPPSRPYLIGEDKQSNIWVGTGRGVYVISKDSVENFGTDEGLPSDDCNNMAFYADDNGDVFIGTSGGLARFNGSAYVSSVAPPKSYFKSITLGKQEFEASDEIVVEKEFNTLNVQYSGLSFINEEQVHYKVILEGLEKDWLETDLDTVRYPAIPYGKYTFKVKSRIKKGKWGPINAITFKILPAWWETVWFKTIEVFAGVFLVASFFGWRAKKLKERNLKLEAEVAARTKALAAANQEMEKANLALEKLNIELKEQNLTDPLTGLKNRRFLEHCIDEDVAQVNRSYSDVNSELRKERLLVNIDILFIMIDIDNFKSINDQYGHKAGDLVLKQFSSLLKDATRISDSLIRWGGEEFLIVARNTHKEEFSILVERIRNAVASHDFDIGDGKTIKRTCSLGFAHYPILSKNTDAFSWEQVVNLADFCLYVAKNSGRNAWLGIISENKKVVESNINISALISKKHLRICSSLKDVDDIDWSDVS